jgi:hypothetical protein
MTPNMQIIEGLIKQLTEALPELAPHAENALSAIRASWERARLPEKRLANTASHNIAAYIMGFVAAAYDTGRIQAGFPTGFADLVRYAVSIEAVPTQRHVRKDGFTAPQNWSGSPSGPWKSNLPGDWELTLLHLPNMPGGEWSIAVNGVPCLYGEDPMAVSTRTIRMLSIVDSPVPPPIRRAISWA